VRHAGDSSWTSRSRAADPSISCELLPSLWTPGGRECESGRIVRARFLCPGVSHPEKSQLLWLDDCSSLEKTTWGIAAGTRKELGALARLRKHGDLRKATFQLLAEWQSSGCHQFRVESNLVDLFTIFNIEGSAARDADLLPAEQRMYRVIADARDLLCASRLVGIL